MSSEARSRVLVVDDDEAALERYAAALEPTHDVRTATTDAEALDELTGGREPGAVLLSSRLDGYGSDAVIREIRYRELDCRLLLLDDDVDVERSWQGVDGRLTRPLDDDRLRTVGEALAALDRIPAVAARYRLLTAVATDDETRGEVADGDRSAAAAKAELDRLRDVVADAGFGPHGDRSPGLDAARGPDAVTGPTADSRSGSGWEAS